VERNPYSYVPNFKELAFNYPVMYTLFSMFKDLFEKYGINSQTFDDTVSFLGEYYKQGATKEGIESVYGASEELFGKHPFPQEEDAMDRASVPLGSRLKLGFQVEKTRLNWIQALTGLAQDALVFGIFYITLIIPDTYVGDTIPLDYMVLAVVFISLPLFFVLTAIGWYYDKKLQVWSPERMVIVERNPYSYIPEPRFYVFEAPMLYTFFKMLKDITSKENIVIPELDRVIQYFSDYSSLSILRDEDMKTARRMRQSFGKLFERNEGMINET
ncbi:MAG: hypothetical protein ACFFFK_01135, partial [Candidatus Thorarchaeota archaeon]